MELWDVMRLNVVTVSRTCSIREAADKMRSANIRAVVVTEEDTVTGIITDRDLAIRCICGGHDPQECCVADHMSSPAIFTTPDADLLDTLQKMTNHRIKHMPVVGDKGLVGIVSFSDVAAHLAGPLHQVLLGIGDHPRLK